MAIPSYISISVSTHSDAVLGLSIALTVCGALLAFAVLIIILLSVSENFRTFFFRKNIKDDAPSAAAVKSDIDKADTSTCAIASDEQTATALTLAPTEEKRSAVQIAEEKPNAPKKRSRAKKPSGYDDGVPTIPLNFTALGTAQYSDGSRTKEKSAVKFKSGTPRNTSLSGLQTVELPRSDEPISDKKNSVRGKTYVARSLSETAPQKTKKRAKLSQDDNSTSDKPTNTGKKRTKKQPT